jgi:putative phosphoesterase
MMTPGEVASGCFLLIRKPRKTYFLHRHSTVPGVFVLEVFVKIAIISDVHANLAALDAFPEKGYDQLWCLGDLVDYGPKPREAIQWVRQRASICVRGNHDQAVGFDVNPQCSAPFSKLAASTRRFTSAVCANADTEYLRGLPVQREILVGATSFYLVHAAPTDPLFGYRPEDSDKWREELSWVTSDVLVVGHTHTPFVRHIGKTTILNPGSLGQPKTGRSSACYGVWDDGQILLKEYEYPVAETIRQVRAMPISKEDQEALITVLETGSLPGQRLMKPVPTKH